MLPLCRRWLRLRDSTCRVIRPAVSHRPQHLAHLVGVDPADDACIHISHLQKGVYFRVMALVAPILAALLVALSSK